MNRSIVILIRVSYTIVILFLAYVLLPCVFPVPSRARTQAAVCLNNMSKFDSAKHSFQMACNLTNGAALTDAQIQELAEYIKGGWLANTCLASGIYQVGAIGQDVHCSVHGSLSECRQRTGRR